MKKIRVHRNINKGWPRYHTEFYTNFVNKVLKLEFDVEEIDWATSDGAASRIKDFPHSCGTLGNSPILYDVDCVIENLQTRKYSVLSFTEYFNHGVVHYLKNDGCEKILMAHFNSTHLIERLRRDNVLHKYNQVSPWFFSSFCKYDVLGWRKKREESKQSETMIFRGSGLDSYRKTLKFFSDKPYFVGPSGVSFEQYLGDLCISRIGLSHYMDLDVPVGAFEYPGEFCYRDMEYMSMGLPFIRIEFSDSTFDPLIPGKHYIGIPRQEAFLSYSLGGHNAVAELYERYYNKFKDNVEYLKIISNNQTEWYDRNCLWPNSGKLTWKLLNLDSWK
jgi:hypothetical protein